MTMYETAGFARICVSYLLVVEIGRCPTVTLGVVLGAFETSCFGFVVFEQFLLGVLETVGISILGFEFLSDVGSS